MTRLADRGQLTNVIGTARGNEFHKNQNLLLVAKHTTYARIISTRFTREERV